jgi:hypothetical protein
MDDDAVVVVIFVDFPEFRDGRNAPGERNTVEERINTSPAKRKQLLRTHAARISDSRTVLDVLIFLR